MGVDLATLVGLLGGMFAVIMAMLSGGDLLVFINVPSILIVLVGSFLVVMMKFNLPQSIEAFKIAGKSFKSPTESALDIIELVTELAQEARKNGLLALEGKKIDNDYLAKGIRLMIDGYDAVVIKSILTKEMNQAVERHNTGQAIWLAYGDVAPAMGMIGTLVGLVQMLSNMSDPKSIGPAMAVALLTTLYGAMVANMVAIPFADKLKLRSKEERINKSLIIESVLAIQAGQNPRVIKEMLSNFLPPSQRPSDDE